MGEVAFRNATSHFDEETVEEDAAEVICQERHKAELPFHHGFLKHATHSQEISQG